MTLELSILGLAILILIVIDGFRVKIYTGAFPFLSLLKEPDSVAEIKRFAHENYFLWVLIVLFGLPLFIPLERWLPHGEIVKVLGGAIAATLGIVYERRLLKSAKLSSANSFVSVKRRELRLLSFFIILLVTFILGVIIVSLVAK